MRKFLTIFFFFPILLFSNPASSPEELASLNGEPSSLIWDSVNAITGDLYFKQCDAKLPGAKPFPIYRTYISREVENPHLGWDPIKHLKAMRHFVGYHSQIIIPEPNGIALTYLASHRDGFPQTLYPISNLFSQGYVHNSSDLFGNAYDPRKNCLEVDAHTLHLKLSNGGSRIYEQVESLQTKGEDSGFLLQLEILPDGTKVEYVWDKQSQFLKSIKLKNNDQTKTYGQYDVNIQVNRKKQSSKIQFLPTVGNGLSYLFKERKLHKAKSPEFPVEKIHYSKKTKRLINRVFPNGRELSICYDKKGRVNRLEGPDNTICKIKYHQKYTEAIDQDNQKTIYFYDPKTLRLSRIDYCNDKKEALKRESFFWSEQGQMLEKTIEDATKPWLRTTFTYDDRSNVVTKTLNGKITQKSSSEEKYTFHYTYDDQNRKTQEREDNGLEISIEYLKNTNLPISKTYSRNGKGLKKQFFEYNQDLILIKEITEDDRERHIKKIIPRTEEHLYGMPAEIEELYEENGQEILRKKTCFTYDSYGNIQSMSVYGADRQHKYTIHNECNDRGQLVSETDALGNTSKYTYDENGNRITEKGPAGLIVKSQYDHCNRLVQRTEKDSFHEYTTFYDDYCAHDRPQKIQDPFGGITEHHYDALGNLICEIDPNKGKTYSEFNPLGHEIFSIDPNGNTTKTTPNIYGSPLHIEHPDGTIESYTYNLDGTKATYTNQNNITTFFSYDKYGNIDSERALEVETTRKYTAFHLIEEINPEGYRTKYKYYPSGLLRQKNYEGKKISYFYDSLERCVQEKADDYLIEKTYNFLDQVIEEKEYSEDQLLTRSLTEYDALGNPTKITTFPGNKAAVTKIRYDAFGREICSTDPDGLQTTTGYQIENQKLVKTITFPDQSRIIEKYDSQDCLISIEKQNPSEETVAFCSYQYDLNKNKILEASTLFQDTVPILEHSISWVYDEMDRKKSETEGNTKTSQYTYTNTGQLHTITKPDHTVLTYTYDDNDYLKTLSSSKGDIFYTYEQDKLGRLVNCSDGITRMLDPHGNILQEKLANRYTLSSVYDTSSRRTSLALPGGQTIRFSYMGPYLKTITVDQLTHTYEYDLDGNKLVENHIDGTLSTYQYDAHSRPLSLNSPHFKQTCSYNSRGNITQIIFNNTIQIFDYDDLDHLIKEPLHTYKYDSLHNRISKDSLPIPHNHLNQIQAPHLEYDLNGNLIRVSDTTLAYDSLDRLIRVQTPSQTYTYRYDSQHRRYAKNNMHYLWDGNHELGTPNYYRILAATPHAEIGASIAVYIDNNPYVPIHDLQGNLLQLCDLTGLSQKQSFTAFGEGLHLLPWGFSSKRYDPETEFIYFGRRYYNPTHGRFITADPEGYTDSANLYTYCRNNPLTNHDPHGLIMARPPNWYYPIPPEDINPREFFQSFALSASENFLAQGALFLDAGAQLAQIQANPLSIARNPQELFSYPTTELTRNYFNTLRPENPSFSHSFGRTAGFASSEALMLLYPASKAFRAFEPAFHAQRATRSLIRAPSTVSKTFQGSKAGNISPKLFSKKTDFYVGPNGYTVPVRRELLERALSGLESFETRSPGVGYTFPNGNRIRIMQPSGSAPLRASFTNYSHNPINPFTGKPVQPPYKMTTKERKAYIRNRTHIELRND